MNLIISNIFIKSGLGAGQLRTIENYDGSNRILSYGTSCDVQFAINLEQDRVDVPELIYTSNMCCIEYYHNRVP